VTDGLSLLRCESCGFVTGDVAPSRRARVERCRPCERRADHQLRLAVGDPWYRDQIRKWAASHYSADSWENPGLGYCIELFADTRALGGWAAVGVEMGPPKPKPIRVRPCPRCGEQTSSSSNYFCAGCHFRGWYGRWGDEPVAEEKDGQLNVEAPAAEARRERRAS
jgi:hypothetical protein